MLSLLRVPSEPVCLFAVNDCRPYKETLLFGLIYRNAIPYSMWSRSSVGRRPLKIRSPCARKPGLYLIAKVPMALKDQYQYPKYKIYPSWPIRGAHKSVLVVILQSLHLKSGYLRPKIGVFFEFRSYFSSQWGGLDLYSIQAEVIEAARA